MKKSILFLAVLTALLFGGMVSMHAQTNEAPSSQVYYVEVYENAILAAKSVCINYGINAPLGKTFKLMDENGQPMEFENALGALNYLGSLGWELVSVYERDMKGAGRRTFYLLRLAAPNAVSTPLIKAIDEMLAER